MTWLAISAFAFIYLTGGLAVLAIAQAHNKGVASTWLGVIVVLIVWPAAFWCAAAIHLSDKIAERLEREVSE